MSRATRTSVRRDPDPEPAPAPVRIRFRVGLDRVLDCVNVFVLEPAVVVAVVAVVTVAVPLFVPVGVSVLACG